MEKKKHPEGQRFYYGWVIVGLAMLSMAYWFGLRTSFSVFFVALTDQFHWGRAEAAAALSIAMVAYMVMAPIVGILVDRVGPRRVMLPGIALTGVGLLLCTQIETLTQFYLFYGVVAGIGIPCLSIAPFTIILSHWFERKRGTANGLASVGMGMSSLLFVPLFQYLISLWGWRSSFFIFSLLVFAIPLPLNAIFLKHRPEDIGLLPDGDSMDDMPKEASFDPVASSLKKQDLKDLMKTGRFWSVILFPSLIVFGIYIVIVHHVRYLVDLGVSKMWAASLFAVMGAISGGFRFLWGWLSDRIGREITYTLGGICFSLGILALLLFQYIPSLLLLYFFAFFFGAGWGSTAPMFMSISGDLYKGKNFGLIYGMVEGNIGVGAAVGTWVGGYIFDQTKNYLWAFILAILISFISVFLVWYIAPGKHRRIKAVLH
jgi:MFS family permease